MCDIYYQKCGTKKCRREISVHIGDFCMDRKFLTVYCEHCSKKILSGKHWVKADPKDPLVVIEKIESSGQILGEGNNKGIGKVGEEVIFIIDPEANITEEEIKGIGLN